MIDLTAEDISKIIQTECGKGAVINVNNLQSYPHIIVENDKVFNVLEACLRNEKLQMDYLEDAYGSEDEQGVSITYHLYSTVTKQRVFIRSFISRVHDSQKSVQKFWSCALFYEREIHEMFGIVFDLENSNQPLLLPEGWRGFPLRKDYAYPDYFKGIEHRRAPIRKEHARY